MKSAPCPIRNASLLLITMLTLAGCAPPDTRSDAEKLIDRSLEFHDPEGHWYGRAHRIDLGEKRPDGFVRMTSMRLDPVAMSFGLRQDRGEVQVEGYLDPENCAATVDGVIPDSTQAARYRLNCPDGLSWWREYYAFMHGMPMKLKDEGTIIHPAVVDTTFLDKPAKRVKVTYDPSVGSDIWYFYFNPESAELVGSRFYHDEAANDGEYIDYDGWVEADGMRLTRSIHWFMNADGRYLGTDSLMTYAAD